MLDSAFLRVRGFFLAPAYCWTLLEIPERFCAPVVQPIPRFAYCCKRVVEAAASPFSRITGS